MTLDKNMLKKFNIKLYYTKLSASFVTISYCKKPSHYYPGDLFTPSEGKKSFSVRQFNLLLTKTGGWWPCGISLLDVLPSLFPSLPPSVSVARSVSGVRRI